jgi:hypothetical protein
MAGDREFLSFVRLVVSGKMADVRRQLTADASLATHAAKTGATRARARPFFFPAIGHYLYAGDTALHLAAAAYQRETAELLIKHGADVHSRNRLRLQPLHLAASTNHWNPDAQAGTIAALLAAGADPNAVDRLGVTPLHRATRTRSSSAVRALLAGGADPRLKNRHGSTARSLATRTTGRGGSGSGHARHEAGEILRLLDSH